MQGSSVAGALELIRDRGIAATRVDFGHSMGGLPLREFRASSFYLERWARGLGAPVGVR